MSWRIWWILGAAGVGLFATGCPSPNVYGTPRTVPKGKVSHTVAAESVVYDANLNEDYDEYEQVAGMDQDLAVPTLPTYLLRIGVAERLDFGLRVANASSVGLDMKWNLLRSPGFDVAIDPMLQWAFGIDVTHVHLPVLLGFNASESFSVVLTPGVMYGHSSEIEEIDSDVARLMSADGLSARVGLGFNVRPSPRFAIQPELTFLRSIQPREDSAFDELFVYVIGVGFSFGNLPDFADVDPNAPPPP